MAIIYCMCLGDLTSSHRITISDVEDSDWLVIADIQQCSCNVACWRGDDVAATVIHHRVNRPWSADMATSITHVLY